MPFLPKNEAQFELDVVGEQTQERFKGTFTTRCLLTNAEMVKVAILTDRYNEGSTTLPLGYAMFNRSIAELEVRLMDSPKWWKDSDGGRLLQDPNVVSALHEACTKAVSEYRAKLVEKAKESEAHPKKEEAKAESAK
jgi:hypothetical protein